MNKKRPIVDKALDARALMDELDEAMKRVIKASGDEGAAAPTFPNPVFIIHGNAGVGKSHLAYAFCQSALKAIEGSDNDGTIRCLHMRWSDFLRLREKDGGVPTGTSLESALATLLPNEPLYSEEESIVVKEEIQKGYVKFRNDFGGRGRAPRTYLFAVHDVEQALSLDDTKETLSELLAAFASDRAKDRRFFVILTSREPVFEEIDPTVEVGNRKLRLSDLGNVKERCLDGLNEEEARSLLLEELKRPGFVRTISNWLGRIDVGEEKIRLILRESLEPSRTTDENSGKRTKFFYSPLKLTTELAWELYSSQWTLEEKGREKYFREGTLTMAPLWFRDRSQAAEAESSTGPALPTPNEGSVGTDPALVRIYSEAIGGFAESRENREDLDAFVAASAVLACRPRSSFVRTDELQGLFGVSMRGPRSWDPLVKDARRVFERPGSAHPQHDFGSRAELLSFLFLSEEDRLFRPQSAFFSFASAHGEGERTWEPRHPTAMEFARQLLLANLALSHRKVRENAMPIAGPLSERLGEAAKRLADQLKTKETAEANAGHTQEDCSTALERLGVRAYLGLTSPATSIVAAIEDLGKPFSHTVLCNALAAMTGSLGWFYRLDLIPNLGTSRARTWKRVDGAWLQGLGLRPEPERTFAYALLAERAYQDHDRWDAARKYAENLSGQIEGGPTGDRLARHRAFGIAMVAVQLADGAGDIVGSLMKLHEIEATDDPAVWIVQNSVRVVDLISIGALRKAIEAYLAIQESLRLFGDPQYRDVDLGELTPLDQAWIAYASRSAEAQATIYRSLDCRSRDILLEFKDETRGCKAVLQQWNVERTQEKNSLDFGRREPVYAIAECLYRATQALAPTTLDKWRKLFERDESGGHLTRLRENAQKYAEAFKGDEWMDRFVAVTTAASQMWLHETDDLEKLKDVVQETVKWAKRTLWDDGPHYTQTICELLLAFMNRLCPDRFEKEKTPEEYLSILLEMLVHENISESHWFRGLLAYMVQLWDLQPSWPGPSEDNPVGISEAVPRVIGQELRRLRELHSSPTTKGLEPSLTAERVARDIRDAWVRVLAWQQVGIALESAFDDGESKVTHHQLRTVTDLFFAHVSDPDEEARQTAADDIESFFVERTLLIKGDKALRELFDRLQLIRENYPDEEYLVSRYVDTDFGERLEPMPPLLLPDFNMYRSMPAYLSRI